MDPERLKPILLPARWNARKDFAYFEERWEPAPSYREVLWRMMRFHHGVFVGALDGSLRYFQTKGISPVDVEPSSLTSLEKLTVLEELAQTSRHVSCFRERLREDLQACEFAERERARVLGAYRLAGEHAWMYPVVELIDYLGGSGVHLDETMQCETDDCRELTQGLSEQDEGF